MRANLEIVSVALVGGEFDAKDLLASDGVLVGASEQLCRFAREHATHDELDAAALPLLGR